MTELKGWHVFSVFGFGFAIIIAVNLTLAFNAVRTFPGLETRNSYVASQAFEAQRAAQLDLEWQVSARIEGSHLMLEVMRDGVPVKPVIERALFGRATSVRDDQELEFIHDGTAFVADVEAGPGNWNLRLTATAEDGTLFQQRIIVRADG
ncbi:MAG: FixH family protein [Pseudomonadota bacterium]